MGPHRIARRVRATVAATALAAVTLAGLAPFTAPPAAASTGSGDLVDVTYTSYNAGEGSYRLTPQPQKALNPLSGSTDPTVIVDPSITYQSYTGFGATLEDTTVYHLTRLSPANREAALQAMFSEANGNNFNLMRTTIGCADFCRTAKTTGFWTYDDNGGVPDPTLANFSIQRDVTDGKTDLLKDMLRINPELQVFASMWSPPAWMKTNNSIIYSDNKNCSELPANANTVKHGAATGSDVDYYPVLADYYVKYIQAYRDLGIPISVVSLQNEPDIARTYPTNCWTPTQEADFSRVLKAKFDAADLETKIWGLDDNQPNAFGVGDALLADPATRATVDGLGIHNYDGWPMWQNAALQAQYPEKTTHLTEITQGANKLIEYFRSGVSSYNAWGTMFEFTTKDGVLYNAGPGWWQDQPVNMSDPDADTPSLISPRAGDPTSYDLNEYYYIFGAFSRLLDLGAQRVDTPGRIGNLTNVAFKNPDGSTVVVVVNRPDTRYITSVENTPAQTVRIATPDGEFTDTIPGDTIASYVIKPTAGTAIDRSGWTATASNTGDAYTPTQAVDGQSTTRWTTGINQAAGQSFTLDLGASRTFDQITLNQIEQSTDFPAGYEVRTSSNGSTWSGVVASGTGTPSLTNIAFPSQTARYAKITLTSPANRWWSIGEVGVYNSRTGLLAPDSATATSSGSPSWAPADAVLDGSMTTAWTPGAAQAAGQYLQVDLGSARTFDEIELDSGESGGDYARVYSVTTSTNGSTWTEVARGNGQTRDSRIAVPSQTARYLRVTLTAPWSANWWTVRELRLHNSTFVAAPRSGWTATASATAAGTSTSNVFDSNATTRWSSGVAQADGQTFTLDTHSLSYINGLRLDSAAFTGDQARSTRVDVSVDGTTWRTVADVLGFSQTNRVSWPATLSRYIRITQTGTASNNYWSIAELDVSTPPTTKAPLAQLAKTGWTATTVPAGWGNPGEGIDGLLSTRWTTLAAVNGTEQYQVDLGSTKQFRAIQMITGGNVDASKEFAKSYEVYTSNGGAWTKVAMGSGYGPVITATMPQQNARYVLVKQKATSSDYWSIGEFNVLN